MEVGRRPVRIRMSQFVQISIWNASKEDSWSAVISMTWSIYSFAESYRMNTAINAAAAIIIVAKAVSFAYRSILLAEL